MKKIIIVNNNMQVGGVQKSLSNLLWAIHDRYDVTLYLFRCRGSYMDAIPENVKVRECSGPFRYLGMSQGECRGMDKLKRGLFALLSRILGRRFALKLLMLGQKSVEDTYDCAIAFLQNGNPRNFYGGVQDFVLSRVKAARKVAFLHCDYGNCGANDPTNNQLIADFDRIAACSDGCRDAFVRVLPELAQKTITVRNFHRYDQIRNLAEEDSVSYDPAVRNVVMVSRLAHEKGIERAIAAVAQAAEQKIPVMFHIVGGGPVEEFLKQTAAEFGISKWVRFYGEQSNPYRYMKNADLFLMSSFHEAAPMVIDEALCLGVPVLTVETTSSYDMVTERNAGWVCPNTQEDLTRMLIRVLSEPDRMAAVRMELQGRYQTNDAAEKQFEKLIEG